MIWSYQGMIRLFHGMIRPFHDTNTTTKQPPTAVYNEKLLSLLEEEELM